MSPRGVSLPLISPSPPQDCSVLAFVLDHLLPHSQNAEDKDTPALARLFLASLAAAGSGTEAQVALVNEVKAALGRALAMAESTEKHARWGRGRSAAGGDGPGGLRCS